MTNYNKILENRLKDLFHAGHMYGETGMGNPVEDVNEAKQALTSLIKELVAEAKPGYKPISKYAASIYNQGFNQAVDEFEQNLLKALEEV